MSKFKARTVLKRQLYFNVYDDACQWVEGVNQLGDKFWRAPMNVFSSRVRFLPPARILPCCSYLSFSFCHMSC